MLGVGDILCSYAVNGCNMPGWCVWTLCADVVCGERNRRWRVSSYPLWGHHYSITTRQKNQRETASHVSLPFGQETAFHMEKPET